MSILQEGQAVLAEIQRIQGEIESYEQNALDDAVGQLISAVIFTRMAVDNRYTLSERHGFWSFAIMHGCHAHGHAHNPLPQLSLKLADYKHRLLKANDAILDGADFDKTVVAVGDPDIDMSIHPRLRNLFKAKE